MDDIKSYESPFHAIYEDDLPGALDALVRFADNQIAFEADNTKLKAKLDAALKCLREINKGQQPMDYGKYDVTSERLAGLANDFLATYEEQSK